MSRSPLRPSTVPHTNKLPGECPHCGSHAVSRKGLRKKKLEIVQLWRCASCKRTFTPGPAALRNKTYPIRMVLQALTLYDLGYSLNETAKRLKSKSGRAISPSTIATWIGSHKEHTTFRRLRAEASTIYPPEQTIRSIKLYHRQIYAYAYHRSKLALLRRNPQHQRFEALASFLENIPSTLPARALPPRGRSESPRLASAPRVCGLRPHRHQPQREHGDGNCGLIIPAVGTNKLRHETLQNFMLANDSSTVAVEIPIWLTEDEIAISKQDTASSLRRVGRRARSPATSTFCKSETTPYTFSITNRMPARTSRSRSSRSMRWRSLSACPASNSSTSNAPGSTRRNTTSSSRGRFSPSTKIKGPVEPGPHALLNILRPT